MGYYHPIGKQAKIAEKYGVEGTNYGRPGMDGNSRTVNDVERDIRKAMMDDYDTREFLKYNEDIRDEANGIKNLRDQNNFIHDEMKSAHKDAGNGGKFDNSNDFAGVAQGAFENYESEKADKAKAYVARGLGEIQKQFDKMQGSGDDQQTPQASTPQQSAEASELDEWFKNDPNSYGFNPQGNQTPAPSPVTPQSEGEAATLTAGQQQGADQAKLNEYKFKVKEGMKIAGVQTRGPQSGLTPGDGF